MTPETLTELLYQAQALLRGSVMNIETTENEAFNSHVQHLRVSYSLDAAPLLPAALLVKQNVPTDWGRENGRRETTFYQLVGQNAERFPMIIPHFVANYDEHTGDSLLLLQDLSATHHQTNGSQRSYWWPKLQCLVSAARDLDCLNLLR